MPIAAQPRIHLLAHASPATVGMKQLGFSDVDALVDWIRTLAEPEFAISANSKILGAARDDATGGRTDDAARIRDLESALRDEQTRGLVALLGGAYFARLLPRLAHDLLRTRRAPLTAFGFSEMTTLVNLVARRRWGRGVYWLAPNYAAWKVKPRGDGRRAFADFWRVAKRVIARKAFPMPDEFADSPLAPALEPLTGRVIAGHVRGGPVNIVGGCLAVLAAAVGAPWARGLRPRERWLLLEDLNEDAYRTDRHLAALQAAGWLNDATGIVLGDFHRDGAVLLDEVLALLRFHLPAGKQTPIISLPSVGHVWPMQPVPINQSLTLTVRGGAVAIELPRE